MSNTFSKVVTWTTGFATAGTILARDLLSLVRSVRVLAREVDANAGEISKLSATIGRLTAQNGEQEARIQHLEDALKTANDENIELKLEIVNVKHDRNKQANLATLRGEMLKMHGFDPNGLDNASEQSGGS